MWLRAKVISSPSAVSCLLLNRAPALLIRTSIRGSRARLARHPLHFRKRGKIGHVHGVTGAWIGILQLRHGVVGAGLVAGGKDDAGALLGQTQRRNFPDAGGGSCDDDGLASHQKAPVVAGAFYHFVGPELSRQCRDP